MAGSIADFKYFDDKGNPWLIRIDKSNALTEGTGFIPLTQADMSLHYLPRNLNPRYAIALLPSKPVPRKIYCQSTDSDIWKGVITEILLIDYGTNTLAPFEVKRRVAERAKYKANLIDTYQTT